MLPSRSTFPKLVSIPSVQVREPIDLIIVLGSYHLQIYWRGDDSIEYFTIRFPTEEQGKKWLNQIEIQRKLCQEQVRRAAANGTSDTEFNYIRDQGVMENPYKEDDDDTDTDLSLIHI